jgi:hypothetical protein
MGTTLRRRPAVTAVTATVAAAVLAAGIAVPAQAEPNVGHVAYTTNGAAAYTAQEQRNLELVKQFYRQVFNEHRLDLAPRYIASDYIQHNPDVGQGREGFVAAFRTSSAAFPISG